MAATASQYKIALHICYDGKYMHITDESNLASVLNLYTWAVYWPGSLEHQVCCYRTK